MNIKFLIITVSFLLGIWAVFFSAFIVQSMALQAEKQTTKTDAIVVLTGGSERIENGLELFANNLSGQLFITGVHPDVSLEKITSLWTGSEPLPECCITLGHEAVSTFQNAKESRSWIEDNDVKSIRLVTSNYHMIRSKLEFEKALPNVEIIAHPIQQKDFDLWSLRFWRVYLSEFHKTIIRFAQQFFENAS